MHLWISVPTFFFPLPSPLLSSPLLSSYSPLLPSPPPLLSGGVIHPGRGVQTVEGGKRSKTSLCQHSSINLSPHRDSRLPADTLPHSSSSLAGQMLRVSIIPNWLTLWISTESVSTLLAVTDWPIKMTATCIDNHFASASVDHWD